ncbi:LOW QUALITY PROTEIN: gustatory receptor for sugar taste 64f-like [Atheta coriaria]|uniref:LOW QUALITY PROTEIN: gustatory receptor for sugar taste 64f-like n=1 Tax=Dalotia coriaria TaxID=877792 RepID=UPI0031F45050
MFSSSKITPISTISTVLPQKPPEEKPQTHTKCFHQILRNVLIVAQLFAQLPIQGVTYPTPNKLNFTYKSFLSLYCLLPFLGNVFVLCMLIYKMAAFGSDLFLITSFIYHVCNMGTTLSLLHVAEKWPPLMKQWHMIEVHMQRHYGWPKKLEFRVNTIAIIISIFALIEYFSNHVANIQLAHTCSPQDPLKYYYEQLTFPFIFAILPYQPTSAISFDSVALTNEHFFHVTRGLILSVAGTVTYELVLIQRMKIYSKEDSTILLDGQMGVLN